MNKSYWVYMLRCNNNSYYTGYTIDLNKRYQRHIQGTASKYTRSFKPLSIVFSYKVNDKSLAMKLENAIKKLNNTQKEKLITDSQQTCAGMNFLASIVKAMRKTGKAKKKK